MSTGTFTKRKLSDHINGLPELIVLEGDDFGPIETEALSQPQFYGGQFLARNWMMTPHVTHHDEADITELETYRKSLPPSENGAKVSPPVILAKAIVGTLKLFPKFNVSLNGDTKKINYKKYYNIGIAVDTPHGLLVPVIQDVDQKSMHEIANELVALSNQARDKGLSLAQMSGGTFTISSIGALGGLAFTPIINAPEVAILGVTKSNWRPMRAADDGIDWRLMLPLSLSYDHRVINGADAAKFVTAFAEILSQPEEIGK